ncbi:MAG: single-stranded-DNA-specific exonuclease RecJ [Endozoicomonadaceae bacterium]|nr:single-stranded-DNA-specific exonuclease RecJ [Endozoicomonadaceae bacterium]
MSPKIVCRTFDKSKLSFSSSVSPLLQQIYAGRGVFSDNELNHSLNQLYDYKEIKDIDKAAEIIADTIMTQGRIVIIGDFDVDGATSCALAITALRQFNATDPRYLVPNRFKYGYGLTPEIVTEAKKFRPDLLITVDNGISSIEGVEAAHQHGIKVVITDHHLPGKEVPRAEAIVNPNQNGCPFPGKNSAGVGVIFYVMCAVRTILADRGWFNEKRPLPKMATLLDLVAVGTVADVVSLDKNNRTLVWQGLQRIHAGFVCMGIYALIKVTKKQIKTLTTSDIAFSLAPRLNAAGRLDDMSIGIELLLESDLVRAMELAKQLDQLNVERRNIEQSMQAEAINELNTLFPDKNKILPAAFCFYKTSWHQGVSGIISSRIKEKTHRPVITFAQDSNGLIKGSARSVPGFHIRDALAEINTHHPGLLLSYGGHAMAAGLTLKERDFDYFKQLFVAIATKQLDETLLRAVIVTDGELNENDLNLSTAELLRNSGPWGQHFPEPLFDGVFKITTQKLLKNKHLKLTLTHTKDNKPVDAIFFNADTDCWPNDKIQLARVVYQLDINEFKNKKNLQLLVRYIEPA